jgi:hypothetical protein
MITVTLQKYYSNITMITATLQYYYSNIMRFGTSMIILQNSHALVKQFMTSVYDNCEVSSDIKKKK